MVFQIQAELFKIGFCRANGINLDGASSTEITAQFNDGEFVSDAEIEFNAEGFGDALRKLDNGELYHPMMGFKARLNRVSLKMLPNRKPVVGSHAVTFKEKRRAV